ncbi:diguanylate cyclase [Thalassomonas sp. RHCl1]|uniref:diguanylate cyclase n=1 Tax=Thalassomonas sp. RHCl1 TaxID=2995320 RepID=UPI00248C35A7|nr:diguanylate cyclase [Thalassomonas sp. RHCl1]
MAVFDIKNVQERTDDTREKPLIMLVDDEIENINVLSQLLAANFQIITGLNGCEAIDIIDNMADPGKIQLVISDQRMPKMTGVEFLEKVSDKIPDTIRIILTAFSDTQVIIDSVNKANIYKFITKPFDPVELLLTVTRGVEAFQMRQKLLAYSSHLEKLVIERTEELKRKNRELVQALNTLEKRSLNDQLTGSHNRHFLQKLMPQELTKFRREHQLHPKDDGYFGMMMIDIDYFKQVNDTYGHDAGDQVLISFSQILKATCRTSDWIVRWGGEEFVVIARGLSFEGLHQLAERIRQNVELHEFDLGCEQRILRTCSMGIVSFPFIKNQFDALSWQQTLNLADIALYLAKNNGRNAWVSLFEREINYHDDFYDNIMANLKTLVENNAIAYRTSLMPKQLKV